MAESVKRQKRVIPVVTFNKWQLQYDKELSTLTWLRCDKDSTSSFVEILWCAMCRKYETSIEGMKIIGLLALLTIELVISLIMARLINTKLR